MCFVNDDPGRVRAVRYERRFDFSTAAARCKLNARTIRLHESEKAPIAPQDETVARFSTGDQVRPTRMFSWVDDLILRRLRRRGFGRPLTAEEPRNSESSSAPPPCRARPLRRFDEPILSAEEHPLPVADALPEIEQLPPFMAQELQKAEFIWPLIPQPQSCPHCGQLLPRNA